MDETPATTPVAPRNNNNQQEQRVTHVARMHHEGPLPLASEYAAYNRGHKGSAHRILKMAEKALDAEISNMKADKHTEFISMLLGRFFMYALLVAAVILVLFGKPEAAAFAAIPPVVSALYGTFKPSDEKPKPKKQQKKK